MLLTPILPESAPFTPNQRAWLNGFFAGVFGLDRNPIPAAVAATGTASQPAPISPVVEDFPWHDPGIPLPERMKLAEGKPLERQLMAAMAQLDCGACGYLCQTYSEAIAKGEENDLSKCSPGGKDTAKKLKEILANRVALPTLSPTSNGHLNGTINGHTPTESRPTATARYDRKNPFHAPLLECQKLCAAGSEKDVRFVRFSLRGSGLTYEVGDALGVFPENDPDLVEAILKALGARGDEMVDTPDGGRAHSYEALLKSYVITKISDDFAALLANHARVPSEAATLRTLLGNDPDGILSSWDVLDLLEQFPSARCDVAQMITALSPLQPRLYSISSSLKAHPEEVHLTVGVVRYTKSGRLRKGVASNFLAETLRVRQKAGVFVHTSPGFRLPQGSQTPVIMVGPGTGIAPFRAFLQERVATGSKGKNWLFFGDQRREFDFLYRDELETFQKLGVLHRLDLAFSRDQTEKIYVQHRIAQNAAEIWKWLQEGAHFYVCGDARRMALDVDHALHALIAEQGKMSPEAAKEYVKNLSKAKRYQRDVY